MTHRGTVLGPLAAVGEVTAWWAALLAAYLVLIGTVDGLEVLVGAGCALLGALTARAARRAVGRW
jgi:hypothetical protein